MDESGAKIDVGALRAVPFCQRWEILKPELKRLFLEDRLSYDEIKRLMRDRYGFDAE